MNNNSKVWLAMAIFLGIIVILSIFMILFMPRGRFYIGGGDANLRHSVNIKIHEKTQIDLTAYSERIFYLKNDSDELIIKEYYRSKTKKADINVSEQAVRIRCDQDVNLLVFGNIHDRIEIYLPQNYRGNLSASVSSGDIRSELHFTAERLSFEANSGALSLGHLNADSIHLRASSGSIRVAGINGEATVKANSGSISIDRLTGFADVDASSGSIRVNDITGGITAKANSGTIRIGILELSGDVNAAVSSGSINIDLPTDSGFKFSANTSSGSIRTDFDSSLSFNERRNNASGTVGDNASYTVTAKANSGSIRVGR